jgi:hypothetical protein
MKKKKKNIVLVVDNEERQKLYNAPLSNYQNVSIKGNIGKGVFQVFQGTGKNSLFPL